MKSSISICQFWIIALQLLLLIMQPTTAHAHVRQKLTFFSFAYGDALKTYGWMSVASALLTFDDISAFYIYCDNDSNLPDTFSNLVSSEKRNKVKFIRSIQNVSSTAFHGDSNLVQIHLIRDALKNIYINSPGHHVVYHDMDVLFLQREALDEVFHKSNRSFEIGLGTRPGGKFGAMNIGIMLFHADKLPRAYMLAELIISIYEDEQLKYQELQKAMSGHFCCAQHVFQHAMELIFRNISWQMTQQDLTYFHTEDVQATHGRRLSEFDAAGRHIILQRATDPTNKGGTNSQCSLRYIAELSEDFTMLSLAWRVFIPSPQTSPRVVCSRPLPNALALHYKGVVWKSRHMPTDFRVRFVEQRSAADVLVTYHNSTGSPKFDQCLLTKCLGCIDRPRANATLSNCTHKPIFPYLLSGYTHHLHGR